MRDTSRPGATDWLPAIDPPRVFIPLGAAKVSAGFPSPAADYEDKRLDINEYLIRNLVVDRSIKPAHGDIVVAFVDGERLVKRLYHRNSRVALVAENPAYPALHIQGEMELMIWGVVIGKFKRI